MTRGEVWWAELPPPAGRRPVLLVSRPEAYRIRQHVTVAPISRTIRGIPTEVLLGPKDGLPRRSVANLDSLVTIDKTILKSRLASLGPSRIEAVNTAIKFALNLP
jgi:mRNA interferase MazF